MEDPRKLEEGFGNEDHQSKRAAGDMPHDISSENERKSMTTSNLPEEQREEQPLVKQKTKRVATLDAFRGLTIVV